MKSEIFLFSENATWESTGEGVKRQILGYDDQLMLVKVAFQTGSIGYVHAHPHSQCTYVVHGVFEFQVGDDVKIVKSGDGLYIEPNKPHGVKCIEAGLLVDTFNPIREDFLG